jgi:hypothetical protein
MNTDDDPAEADPGPWTTCPDCKRPVPCSVQGQPYPHRCED